MKKYIINGIYALGLVVMSIAQSLGQGSADPGVTGANFNSDLIGVTENSTLSISFVNSGFTPIPLGSIELTIGTPENYMSDGITPPTGPGGDLFDWVFLGTNLWRGTNNIEIAGLAGGLVTLDVIGVITSTNYEVSNINVQPISNFNEFADSPGNNNLQPGLKIQNSGVLPLKWRYFNIEAEQDVHHLTWGTAFEVNVNRFEVERRGPTDSKFSKIGNLKAQSSVESNKEYSLDDFEITEFGRYLYRIKQVDHDGMFIYSDIKSVLRENNKWAYSIFPNPTSNQITIEGNYKEIGKYTVHIVNELGQAVKIIGRSDDSDQIEMSLNDLLPGLYHVIIYHNQEVVAKDKVIKI